MNARVFQLLAALFFCIFFSENVRADSRAELAHLSGLLLLTPENKELARLVQEKATLFSKENAGAIRAKENQELLKISTKSLNVHRIKTLFAECLNKSKAREIDLGQRILAAASSSEMQRDPCEILNENFGVKVLEKFNVQLKKSNEEQLKKIAFEQSQKNLVKTFVYWEQRIDKGVPSQGVFDLCRQIRCTPDEKKRFLETESEVLNQILLGSQKKTPQAVADFLNERKKTSLDNLKSHDELLLFTSTLKDKKETITKTDVIAAQNEVTGLMRSQLRSVRNMDLKDLVKTNPAALGQILLDHPDWTPTVCEAIRQISDGEESQATWNEVYFWGGIVVGSALLVTGIGAGVGAVVLSGTAVATTLTTVATVSAIAGTAVGVGDAVYSSGRAISSGLEARSLRASVVSGNGDAKTSAEAQAKVDQAWSELTSAGIGAVSVVPFGTVWKAMSRSAMAARAGGAGQVAKMTVAEQEEAIRKMTQMINEIKDPDIEKILARVKSQIPEEEYGSFLGQLANESDAARKQVLALMKLHPEKVSEAIKKGSQATAEVCL